MVTKPVKGLVSALLTTILALLASTAQAAQPKPMEIWHQPAATEIMAYIEWFDAYTLYFIVPITIFVLVLLVWVALRFRAGANPEPSKTHHNTTIEVVWTVAPILVLLCLALPSFDLLNRQLAPEQEPDMTVKVIGHQWYWSYEYQAKAEGDAEISFDSIMLGEDERSDAGKEDIAQYPRLLAVDNEMVVPVGAMVRVLMTSEDVIHSYAVPAFGVKIDALPGRLNETWFKVEKEGLYYGQCSELCGKDHAFMPIAVRAVPQDKYDAWLAAAADDVEAANKALMASVGASGGAQLAQNEPAAKPAQ